MAWPQHDSGLRRTTESAVIPEVITGCLMIACFPWQNAATWTVSGVGLPGGRPLGLVDGGDRSNGMIPRFRPPGFADFVETDALLVGYD